MWSWKVVLSNKATQEEIAFLSKHEYSDRVFACQTLEIFLEKVEIPEGFVANATMLYVQTENKGVQNGTVHQDQGSSCST